MTIIERIKAWLVKREIIAGDKPKRRSLDSRPKPE
jgi:hypothetical protein